MVTYTVRLTQTYKLIFAAFLTALFFIPLIGLLAWLTLPKWLVITLLTLLLGFVFAAMFFLQKLLTPLIQYSINGNTHRIEVIEKAFYNIPSFSFTTEEIRNFSVDEIDEQYYFTLNIAKAPYKLNISAASKNEEDKQQFSELLNTISKQVNQLNSESDKPVITSKTMYESWWAKLLSVFVILMFFLVLGIIIFFPEKDFPIWRLLIFVVIVVPFVMKVYYHNFKKPKK